MQASRAWNMRLKQELEAMGFRTAEADPGLIIAQFKKGIVYVLVHVDDILVVQEYGRQLALTRPSVRLVQATEDNMLDMAYKQ